MARAKVAATEENQFTTPPRINRAEQNQSPRSINSDEGPEDTASPSSFIYRGRGSQNITPQQRYNGVDVIYPELPRTNSIGRSLGSQSEPALNTRTHLLRPPMGRSPQTDAAASRSRYIPYDETPVQRNRKRRCLHHDSEDISSALMPLYSSDNRSRRSVSLTADSRRALEPNTDEPAPRSAKAKSKNQDEQGWPAKRQLTSVEVYDGITKQLRKQLPGRGHGEPRYGYVYIFKHTQLPGVFKLGYTSAQPSTRRKSIETKCGIIIKEVEIDQLPLKNAERAEKLAQKELADRRLDRPCECGHAHCEWFSVPEDDIMAVRNRWVEFMRSEPYSSDRKLKPFWEAKLNHMWRRAERDSNLATRHETWRKFTQVTVWQHLDFTVRWWVGATRCTVSGLSRWGDHVGWAIVAVGFAYYIRHALSFAFAAIVCVSLVCRMLHSQGKSMK
jgi:hypothetical protein